jgi:alkylhydroperoxidase family enzyme
MRPVPYKSQELAEPQELVSAIRARRGGVLLNLDLMLLHSVPLADGWNGFMRRIRNELTVPPKLRELAICVVAVLNRAAYEFHHHAPEWRKAGGRDEQIEALDKVMSAATRADALRVIETAAGAVFDADERAVFRLAVEMTRDVEVSDATFADVKAALQDNQQAVELVAVIAAYNMVSRFLVALKIDME